MIVLIGMAVGVDYSLFYLKREREERARGRTTLDAVEIAAQTSGHSILVSGLAVIASMAGLFLIGDVTFNSLATGAIIVVAVAVLGSITVLPALLVEARPLGRPAAGAAAVAAQPADRPRRDQPPRARPGRTPPGGRAGRVRSSSSASSPSRRSGMKIARGQPRDAAPRRSRQVQTARRGSAAEFPAEGTTVTGGHGSARSGRRSRRARRLDRRRSRHRRTSSTRAGDPVGLVAPDGTTSVLTWRCPYAGVRRPRDGADQGPARRPRAGGARRPAGRRVGGRRRRRRVSLDFDDRQQSRLPLVIGFVLLLTLLMMGLAFRSVPIALISTVLNLASVGVGVRRAHAGVPARLGSRACSTSPARAS